MNLIDGFVSGRSIVPDAAGSSKSAGANGVTSQVGIDASFGDVLSQVARGDGAAGQSAPSEPASFRETASGRLGSVATGGSGLRSFNEGGARAIGENAAPSTANAGAGRAADPANDAAPCADGAVGVEAQSPALQASETNFGPNSVRAAHSGAASAGAEAGEKNMPPQLCPPASGANAREDFGGTDIASTVSNLGGAAVSQARRPNAESAKAGVDAAALAFTAVGAPPPSHRPATGSARLDKPKVTSRADGAPPQTSTESGLAIFTLAGLIRTAAQGEAPSASELGGASATLASARLLGAPQSGLPISVQDSKSSAISRLGPAGQTCISMERDRIKIAVDDQQTHLPPVVDASPIQQIAGRIVGEAGSAFASSAEGAGLGASSDPALPVGEAALAQSQDPPSVIRSLSLQLEPESLGAVTIRMRLSGARLEVQVEAANADAMRLIGGDKDRLAERLRSSGYAMDSLVVKIAESQTAQMQNGHGTAQTHPSENQADIAATLPKDSQQGGSSGDGRSEARRDRISPQIQPAEAGENRSLGSNRGDAVYL